MADIVLSVASKVAEYLVAPVRRHCGYVIFSSSNVRQLTDELEKLHHERLRVQQSIDEARNNMKRIEADVEKWVEEGETVANKAHHVLDYDGRANKTCFYGSLPNPKARYRLGKEASRTVEDIQQLIARGRFEKAYYENPPPGLVGGAPDGNLSAGDGGHTITNSRASIFQDITKALDDEKQKVIGIYGPGGVGKTTLLEEVEKKLRKEGRPFHMIVKSKVSQTPNLKKIQDDIAYAFGLNLKEESTEEGRRDRLFQRLRRDPTEKVLIILDDLWTKLDLKSVGIPSGDGSGRCRLLLTSRFKDVLEQKMLADRTFFLEGLNNDEAFRLFEKIVGNKLKYDEELKAIAAQLVNKLAGLPLLITSVASTLKYSHLSAWRKALIKIEDSNIETIVKLSYDHLKSEDAKSLFLLCGLIGGTIQVELLLVLGMGLGLFEGFNKTIQDSRDRLNTILDSLRFICLLQDGGDDKKKVAIHDLYSEVVVSTTFKGQNSLIMNNSYGPRTKEKLEKCWAICLVDVGNDGLAELMQCGFLDLKILMLSQLGDWFERLGYQHDVRDCRRLDFTRMKELRVLCLRYMNITTLPPSIEIVKNLRSLYLDHCHVEDVTIIGKLKALQILNFTGSLISRLPKEIGDLTNLRSLNLSNCEKLEIIESGVLEGLINLEELHMKESFDRWIGVDEIQSESCNARLAELKSLTKLTSLEISIRDPTLLLQDDDLPFRNLVRFWINIGNAKLTGISEYEGLRTMKLKLKRCDSILSRECIKEALQKTQYLHLEGMREFKKNALELCIGGFPQLKHLHIQDSPSIKYIASSSRGALPNLESLSLTNLINLEKICHDFVSLECFNNLKIVSVSKCHQLKYLWCLSQMQRLVQLEEIDVSGCDSMQAIVLDDAGKNIGSTDNIVELPNVHCLELVNLPNMMSFCTTSEGAPIQVSFPRLESLMMDGLLDLEKILYNQPPLEYSKLKSIQIWDSQSASSILKSDWILMLPNLELLDIGFSQSTKVVFDLKELNVTGHVEILSRLMVLTLMGLPNLQCMWKQDVQLRGISVFRNLKKLKVKNTGLAFLFSVSVAKCLREIRDIEVANCPNMKAVIVDEEGRYEGIDDIIEFPLLKRLCISECAMEKFCSYPSEKKDSGTTTSYSRGAYSDSFFDQKVSLPSLEELILKLLPSLKRMWHGGLPKSSFDKFAHLYLEECFDLLDVFPSTIIGRLHNLESVKVKSCPSLKSLFDCGSLDLNMDRTIVLLPKLVSIEVESCPSLESLFNCGSLDSNVEHKIILLPKLEEVSVSGAKRLRYVVMSHPQIVLGFPCLEIFSVEDCSDLRYLFPDYTATTLVKLERLEITKCEQMKQVILEKEVGQSKAKVMSFPCLSKLTLEELDNLISFSSGSCSYYFSSLEDLRIVGCYNFGVFIPSPTSVKRQLSEMAEENDESPQPLFNEMVTFPKIRNLNIEGVPCKELWNNHVHADSIVCSHQFLLENIEVKTCQSLKSLFDFGSLNSNTEQNAVLLPKLVSIEVESCPSLESLFNCGSLDSNPEHKLVLLPKLEEVRVSGAKRLRYVVMSHPQMVLGFPCLEIFSVEDCSDLRYLFPNYTATTLVKLERLEITKCEQMKQVILEKEVGRSEAEVMSFPCLSKLTLKELDNLISFGSGSCSYYFSSLEDLRIVGCCSFGAFISSPTSVKRQLGEMAKENEELLKPLFNEMVTFPNIRNLKIEGVPCKELWNNHVSVDSIVCSHRFLLENVKVKNCSSLKSLFDFESLDSNTEQNAVLFPKLVSINVESCPSLESLFNCGSLDSNAEHELVLLPKLEEVRVSGAKRLRYVVMSHSQMVLGFPRLEIFSVEDCSDLRYLFPDYTATTLVKLERLEITKCEQMKQVILEKEVGRSEAKVMSFPCLSKLTLEELDNLISFGSGSCSYYFSSLEDLRIVGCCNFGVFIPSPTSVKRQLGEMAEENDESPQPLFNEMVTFPNIRNLKIEGVPCKELWNNHGPVDSIVCSHRFLLENVKVKNCSSLKSLFDFESLDSNTEQNAVLLPELVSINVESCPSLESLFNCGSLDSNAEHKLVLLPKLEKVRVRGAKRLRYVIMSHSQIVLGFPSLEIFIVEDCSNLRYLFPNYTATTLVKLERLEITKCEQMKEVILEKEVGRSEAAVMSFPYLEDLRIVGCCNFRAFIPSPTSVKRQLGKMAEENDESPQPLFNEMVTFPNIRNLKIEGVPCKELWNNHVPADYIVCSHRFFFENVEVKNCPSLKSLFDFGSLDLNIDQNAVLPDLVSIDVESCPSLESLFNYGSLDSNAEHKLVSLPKLEKVRVSGAKRLRYVIMSHSQIVLGFPSLEIFSVEDCSNLGYLFPNYTATTLVKLERLEITKCEQMKEVILEKEAGRSEAVVMSFPYLDYLRIVGCCNFGAFTPSPTSIKRQLGETAKENDESPQSLFNEMVTFPNITSLEINGLRCKELWNNQILTDSFQKLESLKLENCDNLQRIAPPQMWKVLQRCLKNLEVISCHLIEIIYEGHGMDTKGGELRELLLHDLKNMKHIWQSEDLSNVPFPNLIDVEAVRCPLLEVLFTTFTAKFLRQIKELVVESCEDMKLIAGHEKGEERTGTTVTFSKLTVLRLFELPNFRGFLPENYPMKFMDCEDYFPSLEILSVESCRGGEDRFFGDWKSHQKERERSQYFRFRGWLVRGLLGSSSFSHSPFSSPSSTNNSSRESIVGHHTTWLDEERRRESIDRRYAFVDFDSSGDSD